MMKDCLEMETRFLFTGEKAKNMLHKFDEYLMDVMNKNFPERELQIQLVIKVLE